MSRRATITEQMAQEHSIPGLPRRANVFNDGTSPFEQDSVQQKANIDDEQSIPSHAHVNTETTGNDNAKDDDGSSSSDSSPEIDTAPVDLIDLVNKYAVLEIDDQELEKELLKGNPYRSANAKKGVQHDQRTLTSAADKLRQTWNGVLNNFADQSRLGEYVADKCTKYMRLYKESEKENQSLRDEVAQLRDTLEALEPPRKKPKHSADSESVSSAINHGQSEDNTDRSMVMIPEADQTSKLPGSGTSLPLRQKSVSTGQKVLLRLPVWLLDAAKGPNAADTNNVFRWFAVVTVEVERSLDGKVTLTSIQNALAAIMQSQRLNNDLKASLIVRHHYSKGENAGTATWVIANATIFSGWMENRQANTIGSYDTTASFDTGIKAVVYQDGDYQAVKQLINKSGSPLQTSIDKANDL
ncbi:uncharacterized protein AB675_5978 [Cyphellophora attinorum]|uniref:Uncharacterized protein n=1 Tax=Cyphellophora attinorum TaxID=1664694 RepID=A0A0N0NJH0_9EURO|nr:uncharacterized protein AB675_5978 [Phialophora attinorum]KPI36971.1 hypothetical protein AB675_5978 [Phialophora attinorum]